MLIVYDCFTHIGTLLILSALDILTPWLYWPYSCRSEDGRMVVTLGCPLQHEDWRYNKKCQRVGISSTKNRKFSQNVSLFKIW